MRAIILPVFRFLYHIIRYFAGAIVYAIVHFWTFDHQKAAQEFKLVSADAFARGSVGGTLGLQLFLTFMAMIFAVFGCSIFAALYSAFSQ